MVNTIRFQVGLKIFRKNSLTGRTAVRGRSASRHHGGPKWGPLDTPWIVTVIIFWGFKEGPQLNPQHAEEKR